MVCLVVIGCFETKLEALYTALASVILAQVNVYDTVYAINQCKTLWSREISLL